MTPRRTSALVAVTAAMLACLAGSPAPAQAGSPAPTSAEWHRLHPQLCHTLNEHPRDY
jgi:hypothetical protein